MRVELPEKMAQALFKPARYKVFHGGRGGAKTTNIARYYVTKGYSEIRKVICTREIQKSIQESVHAVLEQEIINLGLKDFYEIQKTTILGRWIRDRRTEFLFAGLRSNIASIKSIPGLTDGWVEEAQSASVTNIRTLDYTIREPNSELILSFNPDLEDDPIYKEYVINPPEDSIVVKMNWRDNPWFPDVLRKRKDELEKRNYQEYLHVWEGNPKQAVEGAIFAEDLRKAAEEHRLTKVPIQSGVPVQLFYDLGQSDNTAIWFLQLVGMEFRFIDYYQASGHKIGHYMEVLLERGYNYDEHCLPHDATHEQLAAQSTIEQQIRNAIRDNSKLGKSVRIVPRIPKKALAIDAARNIFPQSVFDKERCADGLQCLRHAAFDRDIESGRISKEPKHDIWSHGVDAFMGAAQHYKRPQALVTQSIMMG